jgi:hypothetical protein
MAMIQSTIHTEHATGEWDHFQTPIQETWVSDVFCIIKEANDWDRVGE